jgi:hypothetical protein
MANLLERQGRKATGLMHINAMIAGLPYRQQLDIADIGWCPFCRSLGGRSFENDEKLLTSINVEIVVMDALRSEKMTCKTRKQRRA